MDPRDPPEPSQDVKYVFSFKEGLQDVSRFRNEGHTSLCAQQMVWGEDGNGNGSKACRCGKDNP